MPTVTWARLDPLRRAAVIEAAAAEFGARAFSRGPTRRRGHRRAVIASATALSAPGVGALRARHGSGPRTRRAHTRAARFGRTQAGCSAEGRVRQSPAERTNHRLI